MEELSILQKNNFKFNKKYGQNFIFDKNLLNAIVADSEITKDDEVLEIGAGAGTLSKIISMNSKKLVCYEIDKSLEQVLKENLTGCNNTEIIFKDALKMPLNEIESKFDGDYYVVANLPYYITTPLIFKFVGKTTKIKSMCIMVQKEVGDRLVATSKSKDYGSISTILDFYSNVKIVRQVPRTVFVPSPKVDSCIVKIDFVNDKYNCDKVLFEKIVKSAFSNKRKTLANNLSKDFNMTKEKIFQILSDLKIDQNIRGDALSTLEFVKIAQKFV